MRVSRTSYRRSLREYLRPYSRTKTCALSALPHSALRSRWTIVDDNGEAFKITRWALSTRLDMSPSRVIANRLFDSWASWRKPSVTGLLSLPNELLSEVVSYLAPHETSNFIVTCKRMSRVGEYQRYTSIVVGPKHGHRLVTTLLSGSETSNRYCELVKRLWFRGWTYQRYTFETASLFSQLLPYLHNLRSLWVEASPTDCVHLTKTLKRAGLVRENIHPAQCLLDIGMNKDCFSARTLPSLRYLKVSGDVSLCALASFRNLEELEVNVTLNHSALSMLVSNAHDSVLGRSLKALTIKLTQAVDANTAFPIIADAFPNLERLNFEQLGVHFEVSSM